MTHQPETSENKEAFDFKLFAKLDHYHYRKYHLIWVAVQLCGGCTADIRCIFSVLL
jgi:hypothetical protein